MKTFYSEPKFELVRFDSADIVATSSEFPNNSFNNSFSATNVESSDKFKENFNNIADSFS